MFKKYEKGSKLYVPNDGTFGGGVATIHEFIRNEMVSADDPKTIIVIVKERPGTQYVLCELLRVQKTLKKQFGLIEAGQIVRDFSNPKPDWH